MSKHILPVGIFIYFTVIAMAILAMGYHWINYKQVGEQPINFPHDKHAGNLGIQCQYCHQFTDKSMQAGIPSVALCMDCHKAAAIDKPEVIKLTKYWENKEPIPWVKVHTFRKNANVRFSHKRHIKKGVECETCHGKIEVTKVVRKVRNLKMGFCVSCHRANAASTDCWTCHK